MSAAFDILYASTIYPPAIGGAQGHLHRLATQIGSAGHQVRVITHCSRYRRDWVRLSTVCCEPPREYLYEGIPVVQLSYSRRCRLKMLPWAVSYYALLGPSVRRLAGLIGQEIERLDFSPSVVHLTRIGREFLARAAIDFARRRDVPFVITPNQHPRWRGFLYREYDKIYREADAVVVLTDAERDLMVREKGVRPEQIHVTGVGPVLSEHFSADDFRRRYGVQGPVILFLGQQLPYKGIASVVEAAPLVWRRHPEAQFIFIGPETRFSRRLFAAIRDPRIRNLGSVDLETKTSALAACEFLCLPSTQESFGGVYVEAWSHGKAVIGGRTAQIASVVDEDQNGLLARQDKNELAAAITWLLDNPKACRDMGQAGWLKTEQNYSWERLAAKTLEVYRAVGALLPGSDRGVVRAGASDLRVVPAAGYGGAR
ncbi:MAG TPA: glycosyltransferase family 4 protein [Pirellulales bacterium]|jgi:glycosyltransferase involved in cell wall biosynthesis|nr:glycosyltransferase family 4 protein [Pirellulales bacterium]